MILIEFLYMRNLVLNNISVVIKEQRKENHLCYKCSVKEQRKENHLYYMLTSVDEANFVISD